VSDRSLIPQLGKAFGVKRSVSRWAARWLGRNLGGSRTLRSELRHIFPDNWSFFLGETALYSFIVLVVTGIFLAFFFRASGAEVVYHGVYRPLVGVPMSDAYASTLDLSMHVRAGLLVRQVHHWAALVFIAAITIHMLRLFFTGAYRRPRRINWLIGLTLLLTSAMNGLFGYSLPDDLLSGTGLRIAYSITESIPFVGPLLASLMFGGQFPTTGLISRIYPVHIFLLPAAIASLLGLHLGLLWLQRHTQYPGPGRDDRTVVGTPLMPAYALRTVGYFFLCAGVLTAMGAFIQVNPVWLYGPFHPWDSTTAAQPDWYMGWLEGAVRLFPSWDIHIGWFLVPALFWPAAVLPGLIFGALYLWPWVDGFAIRDGAFHNLLDLPCRRPGRAAVGAGFVTFLVALLIAGGNDVFAVLLNLRQPLFLHTLQALVIVGPPIVAALTYAACRGLRRRARPSWGSQTRETG
jgi:ubiquinol-cytochrome c reductase cytochrome b subunit